jgi:hypothetical protein
MEYEKERDGLTDFLSSSQGRELRRYMATSHARLLLRRAKVRYRGSE